MRDPTGAILRAVGARIAELRRERGLTQEALSQRLGSTAKYLQRVEQGVENLQLLTLERFAEALEVAPLQLLLPPLASRPTRAGRPSTKARPLPVRRVAPRPGARDVVPFFSMVAAAGVAGRADLMDVAEYVTVDDHKMPPGGFVLRVVGDSMTPDVPDGALVLFRTPVTEPDGKVVLVEMSEDDALPHYVLKKVSIEWGVHAESGAVQAKLVSLNRKYPARSVELSATSGIRLVAEMVKVLTTEG